MINSNAPQPATTAPNNEAELFARARALAGYSLGQLATEAGWVTPSHLRQAKGWAGQLLELYLGASAGSRQEQDFPHLGVELKTIPINAEGMPLETTYVCIAPLLHLNGVHWQQSNVHNKLQRVLWVPLDGRREVPPGERVIGPAVLWSPTVQQNAALQQDWEEITERIVLGQIEQITARTGTVLQLRPKAADGSVLTPAIGPKGQMIQTRPRGYYLKKEFTFQVLAEALEL
ncbi:DNA mismatch repair endonuclease MutH [Aliidiomarina quisquiliarum]|uniref:DNA mismatch repair endonuclease MutH n=1 Tax=Aliidiomarina quisquiliarum TaxID=2938947 RepID=UPI00208E9FF5|nr:DNA mismatch repair endonuclease MutH [Aliidiomarina quisquiliarum]MCO4321543.1 DNA mismatch repair endonuclease MutH [Aliidiomarina quisquiliarum]